jgi:hypothetical protein
VSGARSLRVLGERLAVCRLGPGEALPAWAGGQFWSLTRTRAETTVVCEASRVPPGVRAERGWRAMEVAGPLDFSMVGVISSLARPLAAAGVSIFVMSTFDTDYLLVREDDLAASIEALTGAGHSVQTEGTEP